MKRDGLTILISSLIGFYTVEPIMKNMLERGLPIYIASTKKVLSKISEIFPMLNGHYIFLEDLMSKYSCISKLHRFVQTMVTAQSFSYQYRLLSNPKGRGGSKTYYLTYNLSRITPHWSNSIINHRLKTLISPLINNPFPTKKIVAISLVSTPHLLCARDQEVITIVESWDHPVKYPVGYNSQKVFVWNDDLGIDWQQYQGDRNIFVGYPLKLRYFLSLKNIEIHSKPSDEKPTAMYAAGTSSLTYIKRLYDDEMKVIHEVCHATKKAGWKLLIKPKPNGRIGDFDRFAKEFSHVSVGNYRDADSSSNYYLDDDYNKQRLQELKECDLVINTITTFALDAAVFGVPVLQLDLRNCLEYNQIAENLTNHHIEKYLLSDTTVTYGLSTGESLSDGLAYFLNNRKNEPILFTKRLREWVSGTRSLDDAVTDMVDKILAD